MKRKVNQSVKNITSNIVLILSIEEALKDILKIGL